jgi:uncharacterized RDD family membrane protein YckC
VLTLVSSAAAYAQDAGSGIAEAGIFKLAVPFIGEVPVPEEFKYPILIAVTVVLLLFYGPRVLSALRAVTSRVTSRESLEEQRIKLEILKTRYEIEYFKTTHNITLTGIKEEQPILDAVAAKANAAAERLEKQQQLVRTQLESPDNRSRFVFRRITALLIDYLLIAFAGGFVLAMLSIVLPPIPLGTWEGGEPYGMAGQIVFNISLIAAYVVYFVAMWVARGATVGKMIVGLKIVSVDGQPITPLNALIRFVFLASMGLSIGFVWLLFDPQKQALHDKLGQTVVVKTRGPFEFV